MRTLELSDAVFGRNRTVVATHNLVDRLTDALFIFKGQIGRNGADIKVQIAVAEVTEHGRINPVETRVECGKRFVDKSGDVTDFDTHVIVQVAAHVCVCTRNRLANRPKSPAVLDRIRQKGVYHITFLELFFKNRFQRIATGVSSITQFHQAPPRRR